MKRLLVDELAAGMVLEQDVFVDDNNIPFITKSTVLSDRMIRSLKNSAVEHVDVVGEKDPEIVTDPRPKPSIDPALRKEALANVEDLFLIAGQGDESPVPVAKVIRQLNTVVDQLVDYLSDDAAALVNINDLRSYDEYTYHHSLSVAVLSIALGNQLRLDRERLTLLGRSALMHDIGKTAVPIELINKPAKLTDDEYEIVKNHSPEGYSYLNEHSIGSDELWQAVLFHHEKVDGSGYPFGLKGNQIPELSRIISIADVYDALTSHRPYRVPMPPFEAIEYIMGNIDSSFDYDMVQAFKKKLELYPVGSLVELSNGKIAIVMNTENSLRPVVKMLEGGAILDLHRDFHLLNLTIAHALPQREE